jgi:hypothetical protein
VVVEPEEEGLFFFAVLATLDTGPFEAVKFLCILFADCPSGTGDFFLEPELFVPLLVALPLLTLLAALFVLPASLPPSSGVTSVPFLFLLLLEEEFDLLEPPVAGDLFFAAAALDEEDLILSLAVLFLDALGLGSVRLAPCVGIVKWDRAVKLPGELAPLVGFLFWG